MATDDRPGQGFYSEKNEEGKLKIGKTVFDIVDFRRKSDRYAFFVGDKYKTCRGEGYFVKNKDKVEKFDPDFVGEVVIDHQRLKITAIVTTLWVISIFSDKPISEVEQELWIAREEGGEGGKKPIIVYSKRK